MFQLNLKGENPLEVATGNMKFNLIKELLSGLNCEIEDDKYIIAKGLSAWMSHITWAPANGIKLSFDSETVNAFELLFDAMGRDMPYFREITEGKYQESWRNCGVNHFPEFFVGLREREVERLLFVLTHEKNSINELHFVEEVAFESLSKWISLHEYLKPACQRTLRDGIIGQKDCHASYNPEFDFTDPQNPTLPESRLRQWIMLLGEYAEDDSSIEHLMRIARGCQPFVGEFPSLDEINMIK
eukprot:TRINITY_DN4930_c0_g1_i4.p1 TRINITY_DN4930_c0_g1~~TRINITY_DN4930_c0_g1_i4.p1  ORF type:complete len:243 (-),score=54.87 TRINITY_DN4930_c0_g1_i4:119-847(-)